MPRHDEQDVERNCPQCPVPTKTSQCAHTPEGREYLKQQRNAHQELASAANALQYWPMYPTTPQGNPAHPYVAWTSPTPRYAVSLPNRPIPSAQHIDPVLLIHNSANTLAGATTAPDVMSSSSTAGEEVASSSEKDTSSISGNRPARIRVTKTNAIHGKVQGAMRGGKKIEIIRSKALRDPIAAQAEASARFLRCAMEIIERCERMSIETGCWLHFTAQHLFAQGPFLHYASPRLLKEGKQDTEQITNHFNKLFASLIASRNEDSKEMHKRLLSAEDDKKRATEALVAAQEAERDALRRADTTEETMQLQAEELEAKRLEVQALKAQLRVAQKKTRVA